MSTPRGSTTPPPTVEAHLAAHDDPEEAAFAARFHLVHEWRKFLFTDPGLPDQLLPEDWAGSSGDRLLPARGRPAGQRPPRRSWLAPSTPG